MSELHRCNKRRKKERTNDGGRCSLDRGQKAEVATKAVGVGLPYRKLRSINASSGHKYGCQEGHERDQGASLLHGCGLMEESGRWMCGD